MRYCVDSLYYDGKEMHFSGWALPERKGDTLEVELRNRAGEKLPLDVQFFLREDVLFSMYQTGGSEKYGISFSYYAEPFENVYLYLSAPENPVDHTRFILYFADMKKQYEKDHRPLNTFKRYLKSDNKKEFYMLERFSSLQGEDRKYAVYHERHKLTRKEKKTQKNTHFVYEPVFSVLTPVYRPEPAFLEKMLTSVLSQTYGKWELVIANGSSEDASLSALLKKYSEKDARIRIIDLPENGGISENTNAALKEAKGDWTVLLDQDDLLAPEALFSFAEAISENPQAEAVYSDEDKLDTEADDLHRESFFKPDFSPAWLYCNNYITHLFGVKTEIAKKCGFRREFDGAQDYDFILRAVKEAKEQVIHVPKVLYSWRMHEGSTAGEMAHKDYAVEAGKRVLEKRLEEEGLKGRVIPLSLPGRYQTVVELPEKKKVSILIPNKDHAEDLDKCVTSLLEKATYGNFEILIIENNSREPETFAFYEELKKRDERIRILTYEGGFNFSAINNSAVKEAAGEYLLFLNNDTEVLTPDFLESMVSCLETGKTGCVGAKLLYEDGTIQHAGVLVLTEGAAHHVFLGSPEGDPGYMGRLMVRANVSAVTGACMLMKKKVFEEAGGFDERFTVAYNDVDLCLSVLKAGYEIVYDAFAVLYHYESRSRGYEDTIEKRERQQKEAALLYEKWPERVDKDPYYNINLSMQNGCYKLP